MTEPTEQVRHLIGDLDPDPDDQALTDAQIQVYLDLQDGDVRLAAADALDVIATSETLVGKVIRTQDLQTDGPKVAASLRAHAATLRAQAAAADEVDIFDVVYPGPLRHPEATEWPNVTGL